MLNSTDDENVSFTERLNIYNTLNIMNKMGETIALPSCCMHTLLFTLSIYTQCLFRIKRNAAFSFSVKRKVHFEIIMFYDSKKQFNDFRMSLRDKTLTFRLQSLLQK